MENQKQSELKVVFDVRFISRRLGSVFSQEEKRLSAIRFVPLITVDVKHNERLLTSKGFLLRLEWEPSLGANDVGVATRSN